MKSTPSKVINPYYELISNLIMQGRTRCLQPISIEPSQIIIPYSVSQQNWLFQHSNEWGLALAGFSGTLECHYPADKLIQFSKLNSYLSFYN